jgi:cytochrome c oxidase subunit 2
MRFRAFTVTPAEFGQWTAHQKQAALFPAPAPAAPALAAAAVVPVPGAAPADSAAPAPVPVYAFPAARLAAEFPHVIPSTPLPAGLTYDEGLLAGGDAARGEQLYSRSSCIGCHVITGNRMSMGQVGPNLTHVGSRHTIAGGLYPNDAKHLAYWIKSAPHLKPGSLMPTMGKGLTDPVRKNVITVGGLTDAEIADIVAYLQALR